MSQQPPRSGSTPPVDTALRLLALVGLALGICFVLPVVEICDQPNSPASFAFERSSWRLLPLTVGPHLMGLLLVAMSVLVLRTRDLGSLPRPNACTAAFLGLLPLDATTFIAGLIQGDTGALMVRIAVAQGVAVLAAIPVVRADRLARPWSAAAVASAGFLAVYAFLFYDGGLLAAGYLLVSSLAAVVVIGLYLHVRVSEP